VPLAAVTVYVTGLVKSVATPLPGLTEAPVMATAGTSSVTSVP